MYNQISSINDAITLGLVVWINGRDFTNNPHTPQLRNRISNNKYQCINFEYINGFSGSDEKGNVIFDGIDDTINMGVLDLPTNFTLEHTIKVPNTFDNFFISNWYTGNWCWYSGTYQEEFVLFLRNIAQSNAIFLHAPLIENEFVHIAYTHDDISGDSKLYLNGELANSMNQNNITRNLVINDTNIAYKHDTAAYQNFTLKDLKIYDRELTANEVKMNYINLRGEM